MDCTTQVNEIDVYLGVMVRSLCIYGIEIRIVFYNDGYIGIESVYGKGDRIITKKIPLSDITNATNPAELARHDSYHILRALRVK